MRRTPLMLLALAAAIGMPVGLPRLDEPSPEPPLPPGDDVNETGPSVNTTGLSANNDAHGVNAR